MVADSLITNFHLPKSSVMMLVAAFADYDFLMRAYKEAIDKNEDMAKLVEKLSEENQIQKKILRQDETIKDSFKQLKIKYQVLIKEYEQINSLKDTVNIMSHALECNLNNFLIGNPAYYKNDDAGVYDFFNGCLQYYLSSVLKELYAYTEENYLLETAVKDMWSVHMEPGGEYNPLHFHTFCHVSSTGYLKIGETHGWSSTVFIDDNNGNGLAQGYDYCYRVDAFFNDSAESYISDEVCSPLIRGIPVMTNVSVETTDSVNGKMYIAWSKPINFDSISAPGPYKYLIYQEVFDSHLLHVHLL